jgi:hypothetical protein
MPGLIIKGGIATPVDPTESLDVFKLIGSIDCSTNPNYPAANAGHIYLVSVSGKIGGASGPDVSDGDTLTCTVDNTSSGDHATVGANWVIRSAGSGSLGNVVEDTTPQLGGDLDLAENSISYDLPDADGEYTGMISTQTVDTNTNGVGNVGILAADGHFDDADADAASTGGGEIVLVCETGTGSKKVMHEGWMYKSNWGFSPSIGVAYVSTGAGLLTQTAPSGSGDVVKIAGHFYTASGTAGLFRFRPEVGYVEIV